MSSREQETRWVLLARAGDREALDRLLEALERSLYTLILGLTSDPALAEDVLQEVFLLIYRKLTWLTDPQLMRPWAYRIATRECFRQLKKKHRWKELFLDPETLDAVTATALPEPFPTELIEQLPEWIAGLSPASRAVIVMHYLNEQTLEEVAQELGIAPGTVKSRLAYGLACLRKRTI